MLVDAMERIYAVEAERLTWSRWWGRVYDVLKKGWSKWRTGGKRPVQPHSKRDSGLRKRLCMSNHSIFISILDTRVLTSQPA